ncbi:MAG: hypothetical protein ACQERD_00265 [Campylobacterota bacterium]
MLSIEEITSTLKDSSFYDSRLEFSNLSNKELLDKAAAQKALILDYEEIILDKIIEIDELENEIKQVRESLMAEIIRNKKV